MTLKLLQIQRCFQGVVPALIATCSRDGTPNVTYLSQVYYLDDEHVALSCQFFNKTQQNISENPHATIHLYDPITFELYRLELVFDHSELDGPLFDQMALRIEAIASQTGMAGIFKLRSADVYRVVAAEPVPEFLESAQIAPEPFDMAATRFGELRGLQIVSGRINRATDLEDLLSSTLEALSDAFGFEHSMVLLVDESGQRLYTVASRGYGQSGVGAEVAIGQGLIGTVARERRLLRVSALDGELRYGRAIRSSVRSEGHTGALSPEIPLPGLPDAQSMLAMPLLAQDRLIGVLAVESRSALGFEDWHEAFLNVVANHVAMGVENMMLREDGEESAAPSAPAIDKTPASAERVRSFCFYSKDDCMFVDGEYLIRNVPGRILWKILRSYIDERRTEFTNRELRMDGSLGLPPIKDNLESRLILLRKRLEQKCPDVRMVSTGRGRFALQVDGALELVEKECP